MNSVEIIQPIGILNVSNANELRQEVNAILARNDKNIILIDFQEVTFIDSAGIGTLVAILKAVRSAQKELYLCSIAAQVKMVFDLTRMNQIFKIFTNPEEFAAQKLQTEV
jgi:anti-anti-sigma factor